MNRILLEKLFGFDLDRHRLGRSFFVRALGLIYLIAIASWWSQVTLLVGVEGLSPSADLHRFIAERTAESGASAFFTLPNIFWIIGTSDFALQFVCWIGILLSILVIIGRFAGPALIGLWVIYLSLLNTGGVFMSFQWDILLLEVGFAGIFLADWSRKTNWSDPPPLSAINQIGLVWVWLILAKLIFFSGWVKLAWASEATPEWWGEGTAMLYHYMTQPIPTWTAWSMHHLPEWFHKLSLWPMYFIELVLPFAILIGRYGRVAAAIGISALMILILLTGNYTFFNWLTIALCLPLVHDRLWPKWIRSLLQFQPLGIVERTPPKQLAVQVGILSPIFLLILFLNINTVLSDFRNSPKSANRGTPVVGWLSSLQSATNPFRLVSGYGLFRTMTTTRPEIILEGSRDGTSWFEYDFAWKVDDLGDRPKFVAPHQPRVAWQFWFAALEERFSRRSRNAAWIERLIVKLLDGDRSVEALLKTNPFPDKPPTLIRARLFHYEFTSPEEREATGDWWKRVAVGEYLQPVSKPAER